MARRDERSTSRNACTRLRNSKARQLACSSPKGLRSAYSAAAALLVGRRFEPIFSLLAPCRSTKILVNAAVPYLWRWVLTG